MKTERQDTAAHGDGVIQLEVSQREWEIAEQVKARVEKTTHFLATLTHEERLAYFKVHQYPYPISFEQEIAGTVYTVNAHFSEGASETVEQKTSRVLNQNSSL